MTNNLKYWRNKRGYTQLDIASFCGVSRNTISSIERGKFLPTLPLAFLLARSLYVPITSLFDFSDDIKIYNEPIEFQDDFTDDDFPDEGDDCPFGGRCHRSSCDGCMILDDNLEELTGMNPFFE